jgi:hypothetical protein
MKTEKAIQVLRDFNLWRRGNEDMEQPDPREIGEAIDDVLMAIGDMEEEARLHRGAITGWQNKWECAVDMAAKAKAERDEACADLEFRRDLFKLQEQQLNSVRDECNKAQSESEYWKAEADRWREVALLQDAQIETIMAKLEHRMRKIESGIRELQ